MRQFLLFFIIGFFSFPALGMNGWKFKCPDYETAKILAAEEQNPRDKARLNYNLALCHFKYNEKKEGFDSLMQALGDHAALVTLANYYISDKFVLPPGEITKNQGNLQQAIDYRKQAFSLMSQDSYPFNDPYGGDATIEQEAQFLLRTASGLAIARLSQFINEIKFHRNSVNTDIEDATLTALHQTIVAANNCTDISRKGRERVWELHVYDRYMNLCKAVRNVAQDLWSMEHDRLRAADSHECLNKKLSDCKAHMEIENEMLARYKAYKSRSGPLLASL